MIANQDVTIDYILDDEGGFNPHDPSNMGVTLVDLTRWRREHGAPLPTITDLQNLGRDEAVLFYRDRLARIGFNTLPAGLDYAAADAAVNEGEAACSAFLLVTKMITDVTQRINAISDCRLAVKRRRPEWAVDGPGWQARIGERVPSRALAMMAK